MPCLTDHGWSWVEQSDHPQKYYNKITKDNTGEDYLKNPKYQPMTRGERRAIEIKMLFDKMKQKK
jgi:hypothetical protein